MDARIGRLRPDATLEDKSRHYRELLRAGVITEAQLRVAAQCGNKAAGEPTRKMLPDEEIYLLWALRGIWKPAVTAGCWGLVTFLNLEARNREAELVLGLTERVLRGQSLDWRERRQLEDVISSARVGEGKQWYVSLARMALNKPHCHSLIGISTITYAVQALSNPRPKTLHGIKLVLPEVLHGW